MAGESAGRVERFPLECWWRLAVALCTTRLPHVFSSANKSSRPGDEASRPTEMNLIPSRQHIMASRAGFGRCLAGLTGPSGPDCDADPKHALDAHRPVRVLPVWAAPVTIR
jgi:hypothetical protein